MIVAGAYIFVYQRETAPKPAPKPVKKPPSPKLPPVPLTPKAEGIYIPPEVPRTIGTIKQMVEEDVDMVVAIVRKWLREPRAVAEMLTRVAARGGKDRKR